VTRSSACGRVRHFVTARVFAKCADLRAASAQRSRTPITPLTHPGHDRQLENGGPPAPLRDP
jgi:hypothetical protein